MNNFHERPTHNYLFNERLPCINIVKSIISDEKCLKLMNSKPELISNQTNKSHIINTSHKTLNTH